MQTKRLQNVRDAKGWTNYLKITAWYLTKNQFISIQHHHFCIKKENETCQKEWKFSGTELRNSIFRVKLHNMLYILGAIIKCWYDIQFANCISEFSMWTIEGI